MAEALVRVDDVTKIYSTRGGEVPVLDHLDLEVPKGDFLALMGPSGSGKSTLLNLIGGLDSPTSGRVTALGQTISAMSSRQLADWRSRHVGFIFQFYNLIPVLTAAQNVEMPLLLTKMSKAERRRQVEVALGIVGLSDRVKHKPSELSGGQQQRVAIARALVIDPELILADEPTGDLDAQSAKDVLGLLTRLNEEYEKTIIMVTHDPNAAQVARRTVHLDKGVLSSGVHA
ncbi:MAG: ABC transporter ATP-binding protein [Planctomycetota bacterium]